MQRTETKTVSTNITIKLTAEDIESILTEHLGLSTDASIEWDIAVGYGVLREVVIKDVYSETWDEQSSLEGVS
jgi:hypothetical protein